MYTATVVRLHKSPFRGSYAVHLTNEAGEQVGFALKRSRHARTAAADALTEALGLRVTAADVTLTHRASDHQSEYVYEGGETDVTHS